MKEIADLQKQEPGARTLRASLDSSDFTWINHFT